MKTRLGFVSNSSSSSFIITKKNYKKGKPLKATLAVEIDLSDMIEEVITTKEELDNYIVDQYGWGEYNTLEKILEGNEFRKSKYEKYLSLINEGSSICFGSAANDSGDPIEEFLNESDNFDKIAIEEGAIYED
jgi:hypothetical protein